MARVIRRAADLWLNDSYEDRLLAGRDDVRGLGIAMALKALSAECEAERARIRHEIRKARGR